MNIDNREKVLCDYGCGQEAHYIFKNGKHCCSKSSAKCPSVKKKLSKSIKENVANWHSKGQNARHHDVDLAKKRRNHKVDNHGKCDNPGCTNFNDGSYGSGRFCSEHCAYAYAANTTKNSEKRKRHYQKLHRILRETRWKNNGWICPFCQEKFGTRSELKMHKQEKHFCTDAIQSNSGNICPFCGKKFDKPQSIGGHIVNCKCNPNKAFYDDAHKRAGKALSKRCKENPQKSAWFGRHHTKETREKISLKRAQALQKEHLDKPYAKIKWYKVQNLKGEKFSVRGGWEVNVAKHLNDLGIYWVKAKAIQYVNDIVRRYTPDFYIPSLNAYIEVKGRYPDTDKEKMNLVQKQNPNVKIYFLIGKRYFDFISNKIQLTDSLLFSNYAES